MNPKLKKALVEIPSLNPNIGMKICEIIKRIDALLPTIKDDEVKSYLHDYRMVLWTMVNHLKKHQKVVIEAFGEAIENEKIRSD